MRIKVEIRLELEPVLGWVSNYSFKLKLETLNSTKSESRSNRLRK